MNIVLIICILGVIPVEESVRSRAKHAKGKESSSASSNLKLHGETTNIFTTNFHKFTVYKPAN